MPALASVCRVVCLVSFFYNECRKTDLVGRQGSKDFDCPVEVVDNLLLWVIVGVAVSL